MILLTSASTFYGCITYSVKRPFFPFKRRVVIGILKNNAGQFAERYKLSYLFMLTY
jgi:hypothetical protein